MTKPKPALDRACIEAELADCRVQRDAAQRQLTQAQALAQQAQSSANNAVTNIARCDGGEAQLVALLEKLKEAPSEASSPAT